MIFQSVSNIEDKKAKAFFLEKIRIYIRFAEVYAQKNKIEFDKSYHIAGKDELCKELIKVGVIEKKEELSILENSIDCYTEFMAAVSFVIENKEIKKGPIWKLYNSMRKTYQKKEAEKNAPSLVDFFCGAGGLSLGFLQEGFQVKLANDIEDVCIQTYQFNHPELPSNRLIQGDIKQIVDHIGDYVDRDIDIIVGGPPCQGFSSANQQRIIDDPRNKLYKYFIKAVEMIAPKFVVMENVRGMLRVAKQVMGDYKKLRITKDGNVYTYDVDCRLLNSQDFSVAQSRERLIFIAVRNDVAYKHKIKAKDIFTDILAQTQANEHFILEDALRDIKILDAPRIKNCNEVDSETTGKKIDVNLDEANNNVYLKKINERRKIPYLFNHKARYCSDVNYEIYRRMQPGDDATDMKIADIMPYASRNHCFKDKYYKLIAQKPCRTITAHLRMDCHSHIHPSQIRSITPREAARVQSFPDDYLFMGAYLKTYMQIGNAVPPMMARGIARSIIKYLK